PWWQMPYLGVREGLKESLFWGKMILSALKNTLISLIAAGKIPRDIAGPVGIFQITSQAAKEGFLAVLQFLGILSVNLAIINILPFPALDGGRLIFLGYEAVFRKKVSPKIEILVNQIGMAVLLSLMVLITVNDVMRLINK
ncbi:MAG: site-2 protease family protein, partial [Microgenomates group bacterium]